MRNAFIALVAGGALAAAALPALAQSYDVSVAHREASLRARIDHGFDTGDLNNAETGRLRTELNEIVDLDARYQDEGMTGWQVRDLNSRLSLLASRLNYDLTMSGGY